MGQIIEISEKQLPDTCFVFKHSTRCPVSFSAAREVKSANPRLDVYWVNVIESREISNWIADLYEVVHQSPQLILIENSKAKDSWSHSEITSELLE